MPLSAGVKLGPYEILAPIGRGGMGEVYRARDTKLKRDVAIKVLPEAFARDPERMSRFQREAEVLASLNHPNIATIHGVEDRALVMELVEGTSPKGPLPFDETWKIASQIASALEYAHDRGIMHRDLKPANILITPDGVVKLLDFGLAKAFSNPGEPSTSPENSPTLTLGATEVGVILGTAAYMAPEQARGKALDKRADIWSFGVVLYELLTGERLFTGEDAAEILAAVIHKPPDLAKVPPQARRLLEVCLQKDPKQRLRDIGDAKRLLVQDGTEQSVPPQSLSHNKLAWSIAAALALGLLGMSWIAWRATQRVDHPLMRLSVDLGPDAMAGPRVTVAISPDGTRLAFVARGPGGVQRLATQPLDQPQPALLAGTDGASEPFFSPDGQWIGFFADGKMKKTSIRGGAVVTLCDAPTPRGASWGEDGYIIVTLASTTGVGLSRVSESGGLPQALTKPVEKGESTNRWAQTLPGRRDVLFTGNAITGSYEDANLEILSLETGQVKVVHRGGYFGRLLPSGHLVYIHQGTLFAVPFDLDRLEVRGSPAPLLENVAAEPGTGGGQFDFARNGTLVYLSGQSRSATPISWLDSFGKTQPLLATPGLYSGPRFAPDGRRLALIVGPSNNTDIQIYDSQRDTLTRLTVTARGNLNPVWTPDGKHMAFTTQSAGGYSIQWIRTDGPTEPQELLESKSELRTSSFSPDGKRLAFAQDSAETGMDLWTLPLDTSDAEHPKPGKPEPFLRTMSFEIEPAWSPDGRWIAYNSGGEVYVRSFPGPGGPWPISNGGGSSPIWSRTSRELFFVSPDSRIMVATYSAKDDTFSADKPHMWSSTQILNPDRTWGLDLAPDGKRFAVFPSLEAGPQQKGSIHVTFLLNFFDELRRRVPAGK